MTLVAEGLGLRHAAHPAWTLDDISLACRPGEITWITGAPGSGCSTLLLALAGLAPRLTGGERRGRLRFGDADPATLAPLPAGIAWLGPSPALQLSGIARTVRHEAAIGPMNLGWPRDRILAAADAALERVGLTHLAERTPDTLSGGETQRLLLAALLATAPTLWLLDEPCAAIDHAGREQVRALLRTLADDGAIVVVATDDADTVAGIADRGIVLRGGRVAAEGAAATLLAGDALIAAGGASTDAATVAALGALAAPRPVTIPALLHRLGVTDPGAGDRATPTATPVRHGDALALEEVGFAYRGGRPVLDGVSLRIDAGEAVGLFGANGAGKSTLLRLAMALERPTRGTVRTAGRSTAGRAPEDVAEDAGFLFQEPERQLFVPSVRGECRVAPSLAGWSASRIDEAIDRVLDALGLTDTAEEHPLDLPLPRRRLVALASVVVTDPPLLLLDEPTAGLDPGARARVIALVRDRTARGRAVVAITHDPVFAHEALDRGAVLDGGRVVQDGTVRDVLDGVRLPRTAAMAVARALGTSPEADRREDVSRTLRARFRS